MKKHVLILLASLILSAGYAQNLQISGGNNFSAAVCDNQEVFVWGANDAGQLGILAGGAPVAAAYRNTPGSVLHGNISNVAGGSTIGALPAIRQIDAGSGAHILGLSCAKQVWAWGNNTNGQLGRGTAAAGAHPVPQRVLRGEQAANVNLNDPNGIFLNNIFYVSGGNNFSMAVEETTGRVLCWGENTFGQIGDNSIIQRTVPRYVRRSAAEGGGFLDNIVQIEGGDACAYALDANGNVWSWGVTHDGAFPSYALGRAFAGEVVAAPGGATRCIPVAGRVLKTTVNGTNLDNGACHNPVPLNNIIMLSGGDTHALALDSDGLVWSFGGDWGEGQLGQGPGGQYKPCAGLVVNVGAAYTAINATNLALGQGTDGRAVYVSAGQANSAVVMANGRVVTFGARGLYNTGVTPTAGGSITCTGDNIIPSGSLGDNSAACNSAVCDGKALAANWSHVPVYVRVAGGAILTGIKEVSDGDAWYYAIRDNGTAVTWGFNRRGELGLGDYVDRCVAIPFVLPTGCNFSNPCPTRPNMGLDQVRCPIFSEVLNSNVIQAYPSWKYTWEYRANTGATWSPLGAPEGDNTTYSPANQLGQYRVSISDNRGTVPFLCAPCPVLRDTITFTPQPNPYVVSACADNAASLAEFAVTTPAASEIKWYTNPTGGTPLNPSNTDPVIRVPFTSTNTSIPGCARALFAEDISSIQGTLLPATTAAQLATALGVGGEACAAGSWTSDWDNGATPRRLMQITITQEIRVTAASVIAGAAGSSGFAIKIYNNNPTGGPNCGACTPPGNKDGVGALRYTATVPAMAVTDNQIVQVAMDHTLPPGRYWIGAQALNVQTRYFNCNKAVTNGAFPVWTNPYNDNTGQNIVRGTLGLADNNLGTRGAAFNIRFETGTGYTCGRVLVCVGSTCVLPVELLDFAARKEGSKGVLNWSTASEKNSSHFLVQESFDGVTFKTIGNVKAKGNSTGIVHYDFIDQVLAPGINYYRLAQYDLDGTVYYSEIKTISSEGISGLKVMPNPNNGNFNVIVEGNGVNPVQILMLNALGQVVYQTTEMPNTLSTFAVSHLSSGVYFLHAQTDEGVYVVKVVKE
ncbi:MAG: T9SS type A sorting domain-containing protein [Cytophagaceae bacterium]